LGFGRIFLAQELGIDPEKPTFLMMSGGAGLGGTEKLAERLLRLQGDFQIIVLAGKNKDLLKTLQELWDCL
jgi:processive 1,2-diacylglycerol beta-glucosyltransferase